MAQMQLQGQESGSLSQHFHATRYHSQHDASHATFKDNKRTPQLFHAHSMVDYAAAALDFLE